MPDPRFELALTAIDAANAQDPNQVTIRGETGPKELLHARLVTEWVRTLRPDASDALMLAARGHHLRRWTVPRASAPAGRAGYLKWRKGLQQQHAEEIGAILTGAGYDDGVVARVQSLVRKENLTTDADGQALEDAICLVFLETQLTDVAPRLEPMNLRRVLVRTTEKMSAAGIAAIAQVPLDDGARAILAAALGPGAVVHDYLAAMAAGDWDALTATLAPDVHRVGPYGDVHDGRDAYATFLRETITSLSGYALVVTRVLASGSTITVELHETVDDDGKRLQTDEAVVFDIAGGLITRVAVYLQTSRPV
jgi:ketosteroid isomerase-like protein